MAAACRNGLKSRKAAGGEIPVKAESWPAGSMAKMSLNETWRRMKWLVAEESWRRS
jgi:hypothetical protein